jgi:hypothetical protein
MTRPTLTLPQATLVLWLAGCGTSNGGSALTMDGGSADSDEGTRGPNDGRVADGMVVDGARDASVADDVSDAAADAGPFCGRPLGSGYPADLAAVPFNDWCTATLNRLVEWTCQGVTVISAGIGADCDREFVFDTASRALMAVVSGCNGVQSCEAGDPTFQLPSACWGGDASLQVISPCDDAGSPPDAGGTCTTSAQCPSGFACVYPTSEPCYSFGFCAFDDSSHDPTCAPTTYCACDGTMTTGCLGAYARKPVPTRGQAPTCADGG